MRGCDFVEDVAVFGEMFSLGGFPGVKLGTSCCGCFFRGELYKLPEGDRGISIISTLDAYEGVPHLYTRQTIDFNGEDCYIYEYNGRDPGGERLETWAA
jgi:gamma-glutamylcyclotransferase (GGCT)/AIG2-like uncharacterized protein YtfP